MGRWRRGLAAGGALGAAAGLLASATRRRRPTELSGDLLAKAAQWVNDAELPDHVHDVARRVLELGGAGAPVRTRRRRPRR